MFTTNQQAWRVPALKKIGLGQLTLFEAMFIVLGGLPLYLPILLVIPDNFWMGKIPLDFMFWTGWAVSMPHTWATYARLTRKIGEKRVSWWYGLPAYLAILALLSAAFFGGFFVQAFTAVNVWQSFHYLRQFWGINRIYSRGEENDDRANHLAFWAFHLAMPFFIIGRWNMLYVAWKGKPSEYIIPVAFPDLLLSVLLVLAVVAFGLGIASEVVKYRNSKADYNCTGIMILVLYFALHWFGFISIEFYNRGFIAVTIFHAIQYIAIVWFFESKQKSTTNILVKKVQLIPVAVSFAFFWIGLYFFGQFVQNNVFSLGNFCWAHFSSMCLSTISAHHYFVDTVIWGRKAGV